MNNLYSMFHHSVDQYGSCLALTFCKRYRTVYWSYSDLDRRVNNISAALADNAIGIGDRVMLFGGNSPDWVASFFAILARGGIIIPLNPQSTAEQLKLIVDSAEPKLLLTTGRNIWTGPTINTIAIDAIQTSGIERFDQAGFETAENDLAQIVYTSGTTGTPKGIMLSHGNLLAGLKALPESIPVDQSTAVMTIVPLFHLYGQMAGMLYPIMQGASITYLPSLSSRVIRKNLHRMPVEFLVTVPELLKTFMDRVDASLLKWPHCLHFLLRNRIRNQISKTLHTIVSGGAPLDSELELKWRALGIQVLQGYGLTETSPMISFNTPRHHRLGSVGRPIKGVQVKISDDGEILVKGANVMQGYLNNAALTEASYQDGWFKTDDSGKLDDEGFLYVFGRKKYMILGPNGENVFPEDLEAELNKHPDVRDSAVIGLEHDGRVVIHVVLLMDKGNGDEIIEQTNQHLASHQKIISWTAWPEADFPRSATRKVKKQDLIKTISSKNVNKTKITGTITPLSRLIAQTTNHNPASLQNSTQLVADLELDSLLRIELVGRIEEEFGVELAENQITPKTTVADIQTLIEQHQGYHGYRVRGEYPRWSHSRFCNRLRPLLQRAIFAFIPVLGKIRIKGMENLEGEVGPVILMTNHLSYLDGFPTIYAITRHFKSNLAVAASLETLYEQLWWLAPLVDLSMNSYP
ncbi:MAG: AMP-binding protein, partial [Methylococcales bacterium]